ncbi:MAG: TonB-dependent receptor [Steroidobacteraceae bacterium]
MRDKLPSISLIALAVALALPGESLAQAAGGDDLAEIVVSARKRDESIVEVPQTITVMSDQVLADYNIRSFNDYGNKVPNLVFLEGGSGSFAGSPSASRGVTIRGIAGANTTSFYIDDTAIPATENPRIVDVERIEVQKGPQGTLFGASSIGGNVRIITKRPSFAGPELKYQLSGGYTKNGGQPDYNGSLIGNTVVIPDKVAVRAMAFVNHDSGFITKTFPMDLAGKYPASRKGTGETFHYGGSIGAFVQFTPNFTADVKLLAQWENWPYGFSTVYRGQDKFDPPGDLTVARAADIRIFDQTRWFLPSLTLKYEGTGWGLTSATSYYDRSNKTNNDVTEAMRQAVRTRYGYVYTGPAQQAGSSSSGNLQQELRLAVEPIFGISGLLGLYYSKEDGHNRGEPRVIDGLAAAAAVATPPVILAGDNWQDTLGSSHNTQKAIFGELYYKPITKLSLTAGLRRYWLEQNNYTGIRGDVFVNRDTYTHVKTAGYSPKFSILFEPTTGSSVYATAAKGFRPGGPGNSSLIAQCDPDLARLGVTRAKVAAGYESDNVWSYELGAKGSVGRMLMTGSVFQTDWKDIQQSVYLPSCGQQFTGNAGAARVRGFEFEINGRVTQDLSVRFGFGSTDAKIVDNAGGSTGQAVGSPVYGVPRKNATFGLVYEHELRSGLSGFASGDWSYVDKSLSANGGSANPQMRGAYNLANIRFGARWDTSELSLYINNIADTRANLGDYRAPINETRQFNGVTLPNVLVVLARPRQVGLQWRHGF